MDSSVPIQAVTIVLMILLSAFFSSAETAMTTVNRIRIQALMEQGDKRAIILDKVISNSSKMLSTILIGNNIVNISASSLVTTLTIQVLGNVYVGAATGALTLIILLLVKSHRRHWQHFTQRKLRCPMPKLYIFLQLF